MAAQIFNASGAAPLLLVCEHASNHIPETYHNLGLPDHELTRHIAWDPGALPVAQALSEFIDAPLIHADISRLVIDLNRAPGDFDAMPAISETTSIPGNQNLSDAEKLQRAEKYYTPFHNMVTKLIGARPHLKALVSIHSFTPVFKGVARPWHIGLITGPQDGLARTLLRALQSDPEINADLNVPYTPSDRVYHTLERHSRGTHLQTAMIEIRNDLIAAPEQQKHWAQKLAQAMNAALIL